MKRHIVLGLLAATCSLGLTSYAQTSGSGAMGFAPANFGNMIVTSMPSDATSDTGTSAIYGSNGATYGFGTGGALVNPAAYNYTVTGPNTATITTPASGSTPSTAMNLTFTSAQEGTYVSTHGTEVTTGSFRLSSIPSSAPLANVSVRTQIGTANQSATVGFVVGGAMPRRVLVRAVGPGLADFDVASNVANPSLTLYRGNQAIATNDDWGTAASVDTGTGSGSGTGTGGGSGTDTGGGSGTGSGGVTSQLATAQIFTQLGAFGLTSGSRDAAVVVDLPPGAYAVQVRGSTSGSGSGGTGTGGSGDTGGGTGTGGTDSGTGTGGTGSGTGTSGSGTSTAGSDVLVEVYFIQ